MKERVIPDVFLEKLDQQVKRISARSKVAPPEFLHPEMRRRVNFLLLQRPISGNMPMIKDSDLDYLKDDLEREYQCYFQRTEYEKSIRLSNWKFTYAGCNGQIEQFLEENDFCSVLTRMGLIEPFHPVSEISKSDLPERLRKYFIGIGYLYPHDDRMALHSNLILAQSGPSSYSSDSRFLSRDLIRCPYHEALNNHFFPEEEPPLSDQELWGFWKDLVAMTLSGLPEYNYYLRQHFRHPEQRPEIFTKHLELGRRLVPQRYTELEPKIEDFEWISKF